MYSTGEQNGSGYPSALSKALFHEHQRTHTHAHTHTRTHTRTETDTDTDTSVLNSSLVLIPGKRRGLGDSQLVSNVLHKINCCCLVAVYEKYSKVFLFSPSFSLLLALSLHLMLSAFLYPSIHP